MFGIGIPELILILIVGLIVFGPSKLPEVGRAVGRGLREFRRASSALQAMINEQDPPARPTQQAAQPAAQQTAAQQPAQASETPASAQAAAETAAAAPAENVPYTAPTQESVRQELEKQKKEGA